MGRLPIKIRRKGNVKKQAPVAEPLNKSVTRKAYEYPPGRYSSQKMSYYDMRNSKASRIKEA